MLRKNLSLCVLLTLSALAFSVRAFANTNPSHSIFLPLAIVSGGSSPTLPTAAPSPTATLEPTQTPPDTSAYADEVIRLLDEQRKAAGCTVPLIKNDILMRAAQAWSEHLLVDSSEPHSPFGWYINYGYTEGARENIGMGQVAPVDVVQSWLNSSPHYNTMMSCGSAAVAYDIGVGYASVDSNVGGFWTLAIAGR